MGEMTMPRCVFGGVHTPPRSLEGSISRGFAAWCDGGAFTRISRNATWCGSDVGAWPRLYAAGPWVRFTQAAALHGGRHPAQCSPVCGAAGQRGRTKTDRSRRSPTRCRVRQCRAARPRGGAAPGPPRPRRRCARPARPRRCGGSRRWPTGSRGVRDQDDLCGRVVVGLEDRHPHLPLLDRLGVLGRWGCGPFAVSRADPQHGAGAGVEEAGVAVAPPHQIRRGAVLAAHLENLAVACGPVHLLAGEDDAVTLLSLHGRTPPSGHNCHLPVWAARWCPRQGREVLGRRPARPVRPLPDPSERAAPYCRREASVRLTAAGRRPEHPPLSGLRAVPGRASGPSLRARAPPG